MIYNIDNTRLVDFKNKLIVTFSLANDAKNGNKSSVASDINNTITTLFHIAAHNFPIT